MNDIGLMKYILGIEFDKSSHGIFVFQKKYSTDILKRFKMDKCNPIENRVELETKLSKQNGGPTIDSTLYKMLVGSLMYCFHPKFWVQFCTCAPTKVVRAHLEVLREPKKMREKMPSCAHWTGFF
jgi:hypothetical protein